MLKLEYLEDGQLKTVGLEFMYDGEEVNGVFYPVNTTAMILDTETEEVLAVGGSTVHTSDRFDKKVGRKLAFQRAVDMFTGKIYSAEGKKVVVADKGNYAVRVQLWKSFMQQVKVK